MILKYFSKIVVLQNKPHESLKESETLPFGLFIDYNTDM